MAAGRLVPRGAAGAVLCVQLRQRPPCLSPPPPPPRTRLHCASPAIVPLPSQVGHKLLHGAAEAKESLASLAQGLTSWWSTLDPAKPGGGGGGRRGAPAASAGDLSAAVAALGLEAGETVLESFSCQASGAGGREEEEAGCLVCHAVAGRDLV